jgi:hypothetical protein
VFSIEEKGYTASNINKPIIIEKLIEVEKEIEKPVYIEKLIEVEVPCRKCQKRKN